VNDLLDALLGLPPAAVYGVIAALAAIENVFPPVPADSAVALGAFLSAGGRVSAWAVFGITWSANVAGATVVYGAARTAGRAFFRGAIGRRLLKPVALARLEQLYARYGVWGIFFSRFIPGVRAVVPPFAGIANLGSVRALVPVAVASALWYGTLTWVAATFIRNIGQITRIVTGINRVGLALGGVVVVVVAIVLVRHRRRRVPGP